MAVVKDYDLYQGDTFGSHSIKFKKTGFNFTGGIVTIKGRYANNTEVFSNAPAVNTAVLGEISFVFTLTPQVTALFNADVYYDIALVYITGEKKTPVKGTLKFERDI